MNQPSQSQNHTNQIVASRVGSKLALSAQHSSPAWQRAQPVIFHADWQGQNPDEARLTQVRVLWSPEVLYLRFECRYRELFVFSDSDSDGRRDRLWERDVAEAFLQPNPSRPRYYKEFEVSPNGMWIDLDVSLGPLQNLRSGMTSSVWLDEPSHRWAAELAIPMQSLVPVFDPAAVWRSNFYRVEGREEPRFYSSWQPTHTPEPNFHVPSAFGYLRFVE